MKNEQYNSRGFLRSWSKKHAHRLKGEYTLKLCDKELQVEFRLHGEIDKLVLPAGNSARKRKDELWQTTCFECFFGLEGDSGYWECNLSPSGDWNLYRFSAYRHGMQEEHRIVQIDSFCCIYVKEMTLCFTLPLGEFLTVTDGIHMGLNAIIHYQDGSKDYLALTHPCIKPDFHNRAGWQLSLSP